MAKLKAYVFWDQGKLRMAHACKGHDQALHAWAKDEGLVLLHWPLRSIKESRLGLEVYHAFGEHECVFSDDSDCSDYPQ